MSELGDALRGVWRDLWSSLIADDDGSAWQVAEAREDYVRAVARGLAPGRYKVRVCRDCCDPGLHYVVELPDGRVLQPWGLELAGALDLVAQAEALRLAGDDWKAQPIWLGVVRRSDRFRVRLVKVGEFLPHDFHSWEQAALFLAAWRSTATAPPLPLIV